MSYASSGEEHVHDVGGFWFEIASTTAEVSSFMLTLLKCSAIPYWRAAAMVSLPSISADDSDFVEGRNMNINLFAQARSLGYPNVSMFQGLSSLRAAAGWWKHCFPATGIRNS